MPDRSARAIVVFDRVVYSVQVLFFIVFMLLFFLISILLIFLALDRLLATIMAFPQIMLDSLFETIGFTTIGVAVFELAITMYDEEIKNPVHMNAPMKIRHFISRFLTVIIISLAIEFLTMVFRYSHKPDEFSFLLQASAVAIGIALLFTAWAVFNLISVAVEQHEYKSRKKCSPEPED